MSKKHQEEIKTYTEEIRYTSQKSDKKEEEDPLAISVSFFDRLIIAFVHTLTLIIPTWVISAPICGILNEWTFFGVYIPHTPQCKKIVIESR